MSNRAEIDAKYISGLSTILGGTKGKIASVMKNKQKGVLESEDDITPQPTTPQPTTPQPTTPQPTTPQPTDDKPEDGFKEADEAFEDVDLDAMSTDGKLELIRIIIDSVQNSATDDDEFTDFMNQVLDVMDEFQVEGEGEGEGEGGEGEGEGGEGEGDDVPNPDMAMEPDDMPDEN